MKIKPMIIAAGVGCFLSGSVFAACCMSTYSYNNGYDNGGCGNGYCQSSSYCDPMQGPCQCTDPNCFESNDCLSRRECCEAFGNIGAR